MRPHLEYNLLAVGPYMRQDFNALEKVQRRATKLVKEIKHLPYPERLRRLGLSSIEERVLRGDLIETYKLLTGKINVDPRQLFNVKTTGKNKGTLPETGKHRPIHHARSKFFSIRVVNPWNQLPEEVVTANSINCFKNRLDSTELSRHNLLHHKLFSCR